jgi:hypothetical protein
MNDAKLRWIMEGCVLNALLAHAIMIKNALGCRFMLTQVEVGATRLIDSKGVGF